ncbi:MAG TPA: hypothetical protein DEO85_01125 [Maritimibacter sp.]|nr:hypothetical protein [Maritimibacter sp.]
MSTHTDRRDRIFIAMLNGYIAGTGKAPDTKLEASMLRRAQAIDARIRNHDNRALDDDDD